MGAPLSFSDNFGDLGLPAGTSGPSNPQQNSSSLFLIMALAPQSPNPGDSNHVLLWKYAVNLQLLAIDAGVSDLSEPKIGSTDNALLKNALTSILAVS